MIYVKDRFSKSDNVYLSKAIEFLESLESDDYNNDRSKERISNLFSVKDIMFMNDLESVELSSVATMVCNEEPLKSEVYITFPKRDFDTYLLDRYTRVKNEIFGDDGIYLYYMANSILSRYITLKNTILTDWDLSKVYFNINGITKDIVLKDIEVIETMLLKDLDMNEAVGSMIVDCVHRLSNTFNIYLIIPYTEILELRKHVVKNKALYSDEFFKLISNESSELNSALIHIENRLCMPKLTTSNIIQ